MDVSEEERCQTVICIMGTSPQTRLFNFHMHTQDLCWCSCAHTERHPPKMVAVNRVERTVKAVSLKKNMHSLVQWMCSPSKPTKVLDSWFQGFAEKSSRTRSTISLSLIKLDNHVNPSLFLWTSCHVESYILNREKVRFNRSNGINTVTAARPRPLHQPHSTDVEGSGKRIEATGAGSASTLPTPSKYWQ